MLVRLGDETTMSAEVVVSKTLAAASLDILEKVITEAGVLVVVHGHRLGGIIRVRGKGSVQRAVASLLQADGMPPSFSTSALEAYVSQKKFPAGIVEGHVLREALEANMGRGHHEVDTSANWAAGSVSRHSRLAWCAGVSPTTSERALYCRCRVFSKLKSCLRLTRFDRALCATTCSVVDVSGAITHRFVRGAHVLTDDEDGATFAIAEVEFGDQILLVHALYVPSIELAGEIIRSELQRPILTSHSALCVVWCGDCVSNFLVLTHDSFIADICTNIETYTSREIYGILARLVPLDLHPDGSVSAPWLGRVDAGCDTMTLLSNMDVLCPCRCVVQVLLESMVARRTLEAAGVDSQSELFRRTVRAQV
jgi:hypothetical protein